MEEHLLIERCVRGELAAQKKIYELYAPVMLGVCQRYVCNREIAKDLLHDGFIKLFSKIHTFSGTGSFKGWMRKIFVTTALEYLRRNDILRYSIEIEDINIQIKDEEILAFEQLQAKDLLNCIADLPDGYRTIFNMHAIEGYTHVEIAIELGISEGTSRSQYARARQMLQRKIKNL